MKVKLLLFRRDKCDKKVLLSVNCDPNQEVFLDSWFVISLAFISDWHPGPRMSASDQMRAMLDQLMGTQRNGESWNPSSNVVLVIFNMITDEKNPSQCKYQRDNLPFCYIHIWLYFHFSFILDPTTCQTWNFIFLGQMIFCEKAESLRWYVRFLIHNRLYSQDFKRLEPF